MATERKKLENKNRKITLVQTFVCHSLPFHAFELLVGRNIRWFLFFVVFCEPLSHFVVYRGTPSFEEVGKLTLVFWRVSSEYSGDPLGGHRSPRRVYFPIETSCLFSVMFSWTRRIQSALPQDFYFSQRTSSKRAQRVIWATGAHTKTTTKKSTCAHTKSDTHARRDAHLLIRVHAFINHRLTVLRDRNCLKQCQCSLPQVRHTQ